MTTYRRTTTVIRRNHTTLSAASAVTCERKSMRKYQVQIRKGPMRILLANSLEEAEAKMLDRYGKEVHWSYAYIGERPVDFEENEDE